MGRKGANVLVSIHFPALNTAPDVQSLSHGSRTVEGTNRGLLGSALLEGFTRQIADLQRPSRHCVADLVAPEASLTSVSSGMSLIVSRYEEGRQGAVWP